MLFNQPPAKLNLLAILWPLSDPDLLHQYENAKSVKDKVFPSFKSWCYFANKTQWQRKMLIYCHHLCRWNWNVSFSWSARRRSRAVKTYCSFRDVPQTQGVWKHSVQGYATLSLSHVAETEDKAANRYCSDGSSKYCMVGRALEAGDTSALCPVVAIPAFPGSTSAALWHDAEHAILTDATVCESLWALLAAHPTHAHVASPQQ